MVILLAFKYSTTYVFSLQFHFPLWCQEEKVLEQGILQPICCSMVTHSSCSSFAEALSSLQGTSKQVWALNDA